MFLRVFRYRIRPEMRDVHLAVQAHAVAVYRQYVSREPTYLRRSTDPDQWVELHWYTDRQQCESVARRLATDQRAAQLWQQFEATLDPSFPAVIEDYIEPALPEPLTRAVAPVPMSQTPPVGPIASAAGLEAASDRMNPWEVEPTAEVSEADPPAPHDALIADHTATGHAEIAADRAVAEATESLDESAPGDVEPVEPVEPVEYPAQPSPPDAQQPSFDEPPDPSSVIEQSLSDTPPLAEVYDVQGSEEDAGDTAGVSEPGLLPEAAPDVDEDADEDAEDDESGEIDLYDTPPDSYAADHPPYPHESESPLPEPDATYSDHKDRRPE